MHQALVVEPREGIGREVGLRLRRGNPAESRSHEVDLKENRYWMSLLRSTYYYGDDFTALNDVEAIVRRVTSANLKASALRFFDDKNTVIGILKPKSSA